MLPHPTCRVAVLRHILQGAIGSSSRTEPWASTAVTHSSTHCWFFHPPFLPSPYSLTPSCKNVTNYLHLSSYLTFALRRSQWRQMTWEYGFHPSLFSAVSVLVPGNGSPLQNSCLENSMDRGAWQATVYSIAKSRQWLSGQAHTHTHTHTHTLIKKSPKSPFTDWHHSHSDSRKKQEDPSILTRPYQGSRIIGG